MYDLLLKLTILEKLWSDFSLTHILPFPINAYCNLMLSKLQLRTH